MVKYTLNTSQRYTLPDAIKNQLIKDKNKSKEELQNKLKELNDKLEKEPNNKELLEEKERIINNINQINNSIVNIKSELYNSTANFYNSNIKNLTAQISDISSLIKDTSKFNSDIAKKVAEVLKNEIKVEDIFKAVNFKDLLSDIIKNANLANNDDIEKIKETIEEIKQLEESGVSEEDITNKIKEWWKDEGKDMMKGVISEDRLKEVMGEFSNKINDFINGRDALINTIFNNEKEINSDNINEYIQKLTLLMDIYNLAKQLFEEKYLYVQKGDNLNNILGITAEEFNKIITSLRKWFIDPSSKSYQTTRGSPTLLLSTMKPLNMFNYDFIKNISIDNLNDIWRLINNMIDTSNPNLFTKYIISKDEMKNKVNAGLDASELNEENIKSDNSNEQIKLLKQIIKNQQQIIRYLMIKRSESFNSYTDFCGKFNAEKYNPNMTITEFKKLFIKDK